MSDYQRIFRELVLQAGHFHLTFPESLRADGSDDLQVLNSVVEQIIRPLNAAAQQAYIYNATIDRQHLLDAGCQWAEVLVKAGRTDAIDLRSPHLAEVPESYWHGHVAVEVEGVERHYYRGTLMYVINGDALDFERLFSCCLPGSGSVVSNMRSVLGSACFTRARKHALAYPDDTLVILDSGIGSLASMAVFPGGHVLEKRIDQAIRSCDL